MKDKRRAWEASPEFMKNTMTFDKDESYVARESRHPSRKIAFAAPIKEEGNDLFAKGKYAQALAKYPAAVAVFRYWNREQSGREQNIVKYYDDEAIADPDDRDAARNLIRSIYLNAAQCMRKGNLADGPTEIIWTCTEVLDIDPSSAKAHYVRALARAELDDSASLELAVKDLARANALAPNDRRQGRNAHARGGARGADRQGQGRVRRGVRVAEQGGVIRESREEPEPRERAAASAGAGASGEGSDGDADPALRALQNMSEEELKAGCKAVGVDLDNPRVVKELGKRQGSEGGGAQGQGQGDGHRSGRPERAQDARAAGERGTGRGGAVEAASVEAVDIPSLGGAGGSTCRSRMYAALAVSSGGNYPPVSVSYYKKYSAAWY